MRFIVFLASLFFLSGCADSHQLMRTVNSSVKLERSASVYIAVPRDGQYGQTMYQGSGVNTSQIILLEFLKYIASVQTGFDYQTYKEAFTYAKDKKYNYLVFPTILEWEDRATEWSGIPDKASIKIAIISTETGKTIDSAIIKGKSGLATFGGDHPQDLLPKPVEEYVGTLY
ncbi:MAG: DUF4823 domain-containing protein [Candidatus Thiodiazotropha sp. (ex Monitilora ramsayi)]|nr:DUF4823 domain-containing protein [Candidatus Thiodiazotropha sp. (ex Monitilora ramsayi)]